MPISLIPELSQVTQNEASTRYVLARVVAPSAPAREGRRPVHLSLVLDRSGSMAGEKMVCARRAAASALDRLAATDRFSVVFYDDKVDVVVPSTLATPEQRRYAAQVIASVQPRGNTDLSTGWLSGCEQVGNHLPEGAVGRVLLLTDGLANEGITSVDEIQRLAAQRCARGVTTSTFGVGVDFNEELLRKISTAGGGAFYFIERPQQIEDFMASETGDALDIVARNVSLVLRRPLQGALRCRSLWPVEISSEAFRISLGDMQSDQQLDVLLELSVPAGADPYRLLARVADADGRMADDTALLVLERVATVTGRPQPATVELIVTGIAAEARRNAMEALQRRELVTAGSFLLQAGDLVERYASVLPMAHVLARTLASEASCLDAMSGVDRKRMYMTSTSASRGRSADGYAMKGARREIGFFSNVEKVLEVTGVAERVSRDLFEMPLWAQDAHVRAGQVLDPREEADCVRLYGEKYAHLPMRFIFVGSRLHDNWFSHWHPQVRTAVVSVADIAPRFLRAYVACEVLLHGLRLLSPRYDSADLAHDETRGCLFDFCGRRADLEQKLQAMDICPSCEQALQGLGISVQGVRSACGLIRVGRRART